MDNNNIQKVSTDKLIPFNNHPFKNRDGIEKEELLESIKTNGILEPIIIRLIDNDTYEILSGHRRVKALKELGIDNVPSIIKDLNDDEATITMVDANLKREHILPSEKAYAYKMKLEAIKHQGKTYGQVVHKSRDDISDNESGRQVQRYIRLTYLIPDLLKLVDEEKIALTPAVELSYLSKYNQETLKEIIDYTDATPSHSQAIRIRKLSEEGKFYYDDIFNILNEEKPNQKEQIKFDKEDIKKYFPKTYTNKDMQKVIITLLEKWQRQRKRDKGDR